MTLVILNIIYLRLYKSLTFLFTRKRKFFCCNLLLYFREYEMWFARILIVELLFNQRCNQRWRLLNLLFSVNCRIELLRCPYPCWQCICAGRPFPFWLKDDNILLLLQIHFCLSTFFGFYVYFYFYLLIYKLIFYFYWFLNNFNIIKENNWNLFG